MDEDGCDVPGTTDLKHVTLVSNEQLYTDSPFFSTVRIGMLYIDKK